MKFFPYDWSSKILQLVTTIAPIFYSFYVGSQHSFVLIVSAVTSALLLLSDLVTESYLSKYIEVLRKEGRTQATFLLTDLLAKESRFEQSAALALLVLSAILAIKLDHYSLAAFAAAGIVIISMYGWLTRYRSLRGWFGDNAVEVLELLQFVVAKSNSTGLPPGTRLTRSPTEGKKVDYTDDRVRAGVH
jgi:hypothetical protein